MLCDLDMATDHEYCDAHSVISTLEDISNDNISDDDISDDDINNKLCETINRCNCILFTCDKLAVCDTTFRDTIHDILCRIAGSNSRFKFSSGKMRKYDVLKNVSCLIVGHESQIKHAVAIINHTLSNIDLLQLYSHTDSYSPLYRYAYVCYQRHDQFLFSARTSSYRCVCQNAAQHGLRIADMKISDRASVFDDDIKYYTSLAKLTMESYSTAIQFSKSYPFAKSLKILTIQPAKLRVLLLRRHVTDPIPPSYNNPINAILSQCDSIEELYAPNIFCIGTPQMFAKSLRILDASGNYGLKDNGINDKWLEMCTSIIELNVDYNSNITTFAPFAKSLKKIRCIDTCGIGDDGLRQCTNIIILDADYNKKITTCAPFANSLETLSARVTCGISDDGLKLCTAITKLVAHRNHKITTCIPFANTLIALDAGHNCGIGDTGLKTCHHIKHLNAYNNPKITTCAPFSRSLKYLNANYKICGITATIGAQSCRSHVHLTSSDNYEIGRRQIIVKMDDDSD